MRIRSHLAVLFALVCTGGSVTIAQVSGSTQETIAVTVGGIFEILAASNSGDTVNWILTESNEFIEASTDAVFRTRFTREGTYTLAGSVEQQGRTINRIFTVQVQPRSQVAEPEASDPTDIATFSPEIRNGRLALSNSRQVVTVTPVRTDVSVLALDLDIETDSNGDNVPDNDEDTRDTLFRSEGSPLRIWLPGSAPRTMRFGALFNDGTTSFGTITVGNGTPQQQENARPPIDDTTERSILILRSDNGQVQYALKTPANDRTPTLLLWDFGDGAQSMLDNPIHTYATSGRYSISVQVRNLQTGKVMETIEDSIMVNRLSEEVDGTDTPKNSDKNGGGSSFLWLIVKLLLAFLFFGLIGVGAIFVLGKIKSNGFSLEKTMEKAEEKMVKPLEEQSNDLPPMEITAEEVVVEPTPEPEPAPEPPAPVEPAPVPTHQHEVMQPSADQLQTDTTNAPDWLQAGMQQAEAQGQSPAAPAPEPFMQPPPPPPQEAPPVPTEPEAAVSDQTPVSDDEQAKLAAEKERKRRKRQRYRENVKKRKEAPQDGQQTSELESEAKPEPTSVEDANEPVAFIKAEDIEPLEQMPPQPPHEEEKNDQNPA